MPRPPLGRPSAFSGEGIVSSALSPGRSRTFLPEAWAPRLGAALADPDPAFITASPAVPVDGFEALDSTRRAFPRPGLAVYAASDARTARNARRTPSMTSSSFSFGVRHELTGRPSSGSALSAEASVSLQSQRRSTATTSRIWLRARLHIARCRALPRLRSGSLSPTAPSELRLAFAPADRHGCGHVAVAASELLRPAFGRGLGLRQSLTI